MLIDKPSAFEMTTPRSLLMYISLIIIGFGASIEGKEIAHAYLGFFFFIDSFICEIVFKIKNT